MNKNITCTLSQTVALFFLALLSAMMITPAKGFAHTITIIGGQQQAKNRQLVALSRRESKLMEQDWTNALQNHADKLVSAFEHYAPDNYRGYKKFKAKSWSPAFDRDHDKVYDSWFSIADRWSARYSRLHDLFNAWANLNNASIYMQSYLCSGKKEDLKQVESKLATVKSTLKPRKPENKHLRARNGSFFWHSEIQTTAYRRSIELYPRPTSFFSSAPAAIRSFRRVT